MLTSVPRTDLVVTSFFTMANVEQAPSLDVAGVPNPASRSKAKSNNRQRMEQLYALPAPIRTFPLPTFIPHNPLSLLHVLYVWVSQAINRPISNFAPLYQGIWSPETRSVHVTDNRSIRGLWEQGFYGKGTLSRSEPNWMDREKNLVGAERAATRSTAEENTVQRRAIRQQTKWERARKERDAIDQIRLEEAALEIAMMTAKKESIPEELPELSMDSDASVTTSEPEPAAPISTRISLPPTGPLELLLLPNSVSDAYLLLKFTKLLPLKASSNWSSHQCIYAAPVGPSELLALPNSFHDIEVHPLETFEPVEDIDPDPVSESMPPGNGNAALNGQPKLNNTYINGFADIHEVSKASVAPDDNLDKGDMTGDLVPERPRVKQHKCVRFSPTVEKNTFLQSQPPSPELASPELKEQPLAIVSKEHFQLTMQETFFLTYALGSLVVLDPVTEAAIPNETLFDIFRKNSKFPPMANPSLSPDDSFMTSYVVYHHFRSLGWCVRGGAKFSCDFMLYQRGPPFTHAEYALLIIPSYTDEYWSRDIFLQNYVKGKQTRSWHWLHCINRVTTQAKKTLVLVYVDIPKPLSAEAEKSLGVDGILKRYKVREFIVKRWARDRER